jgi:uncharacterized membrane protein
MTEEEIRALGEIRAEQSALRERWRQIELRIQALEAGVRAPVEAVPAPPLPAVAAEPPPATRESLEMRIGGDWFVRVGIVLLLTSLAFLGNYLYQHVVPRLGPAGKVSLLYLGAGALAGFGAWLERSRQAREQPGLQNYARVVLAGGLAAIYYVTYAAHYYPNLQVIASPLAAGALLLAWTAFMVWLADRRNSEVLATGAILLAFYTSAINETAGFTLYANMALAAGAAVLLRRHLWSFLPIASVLATYGSYGFWRDFHAMFSWQAPHAGDFWTDVAFLGVYWLLFTGTVFFPGQGVPGNARAALAGLNNGAYFALAGWPLIVDAPTSYYWRWPVACGAVLLALAAASRRLRSRLDAASEGVFVTEGVLLLTLGILCYFSGWQLSLALVVESTALLLATGRRRNPLLWGLSCLSAGLAFKFVVESPAIPFPQSALAGTGALLLFNAWHCARLRPPAAAPDWDEAGWRRENPEEGWFALLAVIAWWVGIDRSVAPGAWNGVAYIAAALAITAASGPLRLPRLPVMVAITFVVAAHIHQLLTLSAADSGWAALLIFAGTAVLSELWRRHSKTLSFSRVLACLAALTAWRQLSVHVQQWHAPAFSLTGAWSLYAAAIFGLGLILHERAYRLAGLVILGAALVHVVLWDIWQLDSLGRAISALSLGAVLLAVGFLYNRYRSSLRDIF